MPTFINFLLESSMLMGLFVTFYFLVFRKHANPTANRVYLLIALLLVVSVPFMSFKLPYSANNIKIEQVGNKHLNQTQDNLEAPISPPLGFVASATDSYNEVVETSIEPSISKAKLLHIIYLIGLIILVTRAIICIVKLKLLKGEYKTIKFNGRRLIVAGNNYQPFSFVGLIVIPHEVWESEYRDGIIQHETAHISQRHSIDIIISELILIFQWFNPFAWLNKRFIQENHEFLADQSVLNSGINVTEYKKMLLFRVMGTSFDLGNNFNHSLTKKRFKMLTHSEDRRKSLFSIGASILLIVSSIMFFACSNMTDPMGVNVKTLFSGQPFKYYRACNIARLNVKSIELNSKYTIVTLPSGQFSSAFAIGKETYITPGNNSSKRYYLEKHKGEGELNQLSNEHKEFILYFPRISERIQTININGNVEEGSLKIYELEMYKREKFETKVVYENNNAAEDIKVIDQPKYGAMQGGFNITKIEFGSNYTVVSFRHDNRGHEWFWVPSQTCICSSDGGEQLYMNAAEGVDTDCFLREQRVYEYKLFFPPLPHGTKLMNLKETNQNGNWAVYEIELVKK